MANSKAIKTDWHTNVFQRLFDADSADCRFQFIDEASSKTEEIPVHRKVLGALSPVFAAMFNGSWDENANAIVIKDASFELFEEFIKYFYQDTIELTVENVSSLLVLADKYDVKDLVGHCETFMVEQLSIDNALNFFAIAERFGRSNLKTECERLFVDKPEGILQSDSFPDCDAATLATFLRMVPKSCDIEIVFDACIEWAEVKCEENEKDETNMENLRS